MWDGSKTEWRVGAPDYNEQGKRKGKTKDADKTRKEEVEGTKKTKLFKTLLASVSPELVRVNTSSSRKFRNSLFQLNKANSESRPYAGAGTVLQFAVALGSKAREEYVSELLQHGYREQLACGLS